MLKNLLKLLLWIPWIFSDASVYLQENRLRRVGPIECTDSGYQLTYECTTVGGVATQWIVNSTQDRCQVVLLHSIVRNGGRAMDTCSTDNETVVVGQSSSAVDHCHIGGYRISENTCYFTRMNITFHTFLTDFTVQCNLIVNMSVTTNAGMDTISSKAGDVNAASTDRDIFCSASVKIYFD